MAIQPPIGPVQNFYDSVSIEKSSKEEIDRSTHFYAITGLAHLSEGTLANNSNENSFISRRYKGEQ